MKLHPSYIADLQSLEPLDNLWMRSNVPMFCDTACTLPVDNPCSLEVITLADIRFKDPPTLTIIDKNGNEVYVSQPILVDDSYGTTAPIPLAPNWNEIVGTPSTFAPTAHNQAWSTITATPTTLIGYGITDAFTQTLADARYLKLSGGTLTGGVTFKAGANFAGGRLNLSKNGAIGVDRQTHGFGFGDAYTGIVSFYGAEANAINALGNAGAGASDGPFLYGYRGVSLGYSSVGVNNENLVAALKTDMLNVYVGGSISEAGTLLSAKYAPIAHTQLASTITDFATAADARITAQKGVALGVTPLDSGAKISTTYLPASILGQVHYNGTWNATTNIPALATASTDKGGYYIVSVAGTYNSIDFQVGDWCISDGTTWSKVDNTDAISSWNGRTGAILPIKADYSTWFADLSGAYADPAWITALAWSKITGKPTTLAGYGITDAASSSHTHTFASLTSKPTTLSGFGITDAVSSSDSRLTDTRTPTNQAWYLYGDNASVTKLGTASSSSQATLKKSGFYSNSSWTDSPVANTWTHLIHNQYVNDAGSTNSWSFDIAANFGSAASPGSAENYYMRCIANSITTGWRKLWHDGNFDPNRVSSLETRMTGVDNNWGNYVAKTAMAGTANYIPVFTGANSIGSSILKCDATWGIVSVCQTPTNGQLGYHITNPTTGKAWQFNYRTSDDAFRWGYHNGTAWSADLMCLSTTGNLTLDSGEIYATRLRAKNQGATTSGLVLNTPTAQWAGICISGSGTQTTMTFSQVDAVGSLIRKSDIAANDAFLDGKITTGNGSLFNGDITVNSCGYIGYIRGNCGWTGVGSGERFIFNGTAYFSSTLTIGSETVNAAALKRLNSSSNSYGVNRLYRADGTDQYWIEARWEAGWVGNNSWRLRGQNNQGPDTQAGINTVLVDYAYNAYGSVTADTATVAKKLLSVSGTTVQASTWNPLGISNLTTQVWGQACTHASLNADSGAICFWLRNGVYNTSGTELCVVIDGDYYAGGGTNKVWHAGNLSLTNTSFAGNIYTTGSFQAANYVLGSSAYMGMWAINNTYAWFGLNGTNGNTWATANGLGTNGTDTWLCASGSLRGCAGNNTDALWITASELYTKNSIFSFGSFVGSVVASSDSLGSASRLGVLSANKQNGWCISYGASGDMQLWDSTANDWKLRYRFTQLAMKMPIYAVAGSSGTTIAAPLYDGEVRLYRGATGQGACYLKCRAATEIVRYRTDAGAKVDLSTAATNVPVDIQGTVVMLIWAMNGASDGRWTMLS